MFFKKVLIGLCIFYCFGLNAATYSPPFWSNYDSLTVKINHGDYPFPTEATFAHFADHHIESTTVEFDPESVKEGDTIFLRDWFIPWFVKYIHPKIKHPYILISNDSDGYHPDPGVWDFDEKNGWPPPIEATRILLYDPKVAAWFCKNMLISRHPKIIQIPIGPNILYWGVFHQKDFLLNLSTQPIVKEYLLYMNMQLASHPSRPIIADYFEDKPFCFSRMLKYNKYGTALSRTEFYEELARAKFVLAPPGYGPDTVRFWEAIVLDCIPVVKHSELDDLYSDLPVLFVHSWEDIDEDLLNKKYSELKVCSKEKGYFDHWAKKITECQKMVRSRKNDFSKVEATKFSEKIKQNLIRVFETFKGNSERKLLCKGAILGLRPFQIAEIYDPFTQIYVQDRWGAWSHENPASHLIKFTKDPLIKTKKKIVPVKYGEGDVPNSLLDNRAKAPTHIFLDLSYLRSDLETDLHHIYPKAFSKTVICGNLADDQYVKEVLERFSKKYNVNVDQKGDIWFIVK